MSSDQVTRFPSDPIGGWGPRKDPRAVFRNPAVRAHYVLP